MRSPSKINDVMEMLEKTRGLAHTSSCMEIIGRCNDIIIKSVKLALKRMGKEAEGPYTLNQLKEAGLPDWYLETIHKTCSEAGILPFCTFILKVPESKVGCAKLDAKRALDVTEKIVDATKKFLEMS